MPDLQSPPLAADHLLALDDLEHNLQAQHTLHERLRTCLDVTREAVREARMSDVAAGCREQQDIAGRLGELEQSRLALLGGLTHALRPGAVVPLTVGELAATLEAGRGERLSRIGGDLKLLVEDVRRRTTVLGDAMGKLNRHMIGIMQTVGSALSRAGVYGRRGHVDPGAQLEFNVDVKT